MSKSSPTQKSKKLLETKGYVVGITEHWNAFAGRRMDLFGFIDMIAIRQDEILAVQTTTSNNLSARRKKIALEKRSLEWINAGGKIQIHGWNKNEVKIEMYP